MNHKNWDIYQLISLIRSSAIDELLPRFSKVKELKKDDNSILTEADIAMQEKVQLGLSNIDKDILFLGEEMSLQDQQQIVKDKNKSIWVLDPLDGTTNFSAGIPYYATSLALIENGEVILGIVYDPERDECFYSEKGEYAKFQYGNHVEEKLSNKSNIIQLNDAVACVDLKRLPNELAVKLVSQHPFRSQRSFGGVALDWCWLAAGRFDVYLHGKQNMWDYAAGHFIFSQAKGYSCTLEGEPVFVNDLIPRSGVAASDLHLFNEWKKWLGVNIEK